MRGANYAPEITVEPGAPEFAAAGARIDLPRFTAIDDSGKTPTTTVEVYNSEHRVDVDGDAFTIEGYDDHFIVIKATDADGSTYKPRCTASRSAMTASTPRRCSDTSVRSPPSVPNPEMPD